MKDVATMKVELKKLIDTAAGRVPADLVIKNCKIVNVFSGKIQEGDIAFSGNQIAGIGEYEGVKVIDAEGRYAAPGFIDSHIHIESSYVSPEEIGRLLVPHGGTTIMADPHEIVNVCGIAGLDYMMKAAENTVLDVKYELPSCVPATPFEHSGAVIDAEAMKEPITREGIAGLGEFMNFPGVINAADSDLDKIIVAKQEGKFIDGHGPGITGKELNAYAAARIAADHECSTVEEMRDRLERGMYILLRQGSACHNLRTLLKGVTAENSRRCLLKSNKVNVIKILPGGVVTAKDTAEIELDANREFVRNPEVDLVKVAVVERHQGTGNVACGFLKGYGIKEGAVALSVAHDSHNIIVVGVNDEEMEFAVNSLIEQEGGIVLVKEGKVIESMPMPIAGLMSDQSGEWVDQKLTDIHEKAYEELGICGDVEPVMTLCFMSLAVIPEIKLTDMGLFDVTTFSFIPVEVE